MQMSSPFPGMDPYIEDPEVWSDFHGGLADEMRAQLNSVLQPRYVARLTPRVTYDIIEVAERRNVRPDVGIWQPQPPRTLTNCLDSDSERVDKMGHLCSDGWRRTVHLPR